MPNLTKPLILAAATLAVATPTFANNGNGWGVGKIPPGHQKKMQQQYVQPQYIQPQIVQPQYVQPQYVQPAPVLSNYVVIQEPSSYGLPPVPADQLYVRQDNEIYRIMRDTATVVEAIGIVSDLLN